MSVPTVRAVSKTPVPRAMPIPTPISSTRLLLVHQSNRVLAELASLRALESERPSREPLQSETCTKQSPVIPTCNQPQPQLQLQLQLQLQQLLPPLRQHDRHAPSALPIEQQPPIPKPNSHRQVLDQHAASAHSTRPSPSRRLTQSGAGPRPRPRAAAIDSSAPPIEMPA